MTRWQAYHLARDIPDALQALANASGAARIIAGGTDLLLDIEQGRHAPVHTLVDVTRIHEMTAVEVRGNALFVGAAATLHDLIASPLLGAHAQALVEACALIGGPQVRNTATLGGNVAHALPAGDGTIALTALAARAEIASNEGQQIRMLAELYRGPGQSTLRPDAELLVGFHLPLAEQGEASAFRRVMRPQGVAIAILNMGVWLRRTEDRIDEIRIAVGPAGPTPRRMHSTEQALAGRSPTAAALTDALDALLGEAQFRSSPHRASADYRHLVVAALLREAMDAAWKGGEFR